MIEIDTLTKMINYSNDIISNKIVSCQKHKWACQRFLDDLEKSKNNESEWIFDESKADRFLKFMTLFKHRIGILAGQHIDPHIIQIFIFGNIYGWVNRETGLRRFRKCYWQVGRKNAKSQSMAIVGLYEISGFGEPYSHAYIAATKKDQAKIIWDEANSIYKSSKYVKDKFKTTYGKIEHIRSESYIKAMSKDDRLSGDGFNPQVALIDEYHAHKTTEYVNVLESGMIARIQPLSCIITTAGVDLNCPCYRNEYEYCSKILNPFTDVKNDKYFIMINEYEKDDDGNVVDDINDEKLYLKANPIAASYAKGIENIKERVKIALEVPEEMKDVMTKNFNVWVNLDECKYMNMEFWKKCETKDFEIKNREVTVGVDLAEVHDLCSVGIVFEDNDKVIDVLSHSFIAEGMLKQKIKTDRVPYDLWAKEGYITIVPGMSVDHRYVKDWIIEFEKKYNLNIKEIAYDPWGGTQFANELSELGYVMVMMRQGYKTLSEGTKKFRARAYDKQIRYIKNKCLSWAMSNAISDKDRNANILLNKEKSPFRIDPVAAIINAFCRVITRLEEKSVYDDREDGKKLFDF